MLCMFLGKHCVAVEGFVLLQLMTGFSFWEVILGFSLKVAFISFQKTKINKGHVA